MSVPCSAHKRHAPVNRTIEFHHVIPVAWQLSWQPATPPFPGPDQDGRGQLWDCRTVPLCPTGHRNTHFWIVSLMKTGLADPSAMGAAVKSAAPEYRVAMLAVTRFAAVGGDLVALQKAGEWGEA